MIGVLKKINTKNTIFSFILFGFLIFVGCTQKTESLSNKTQALVPLEINASGEPALSGENISTNATNVTNVSSNMSSFVSGEDLGDLEDVDSENIDDLDLIPEDI
ncbi:MAG: hypothetical protein AB1391_00380 [Candidatus Micrarchaeota archaeon]